MDCRMFLRQASPDIAQAWKMSKRIAQIKLVKAYSQNDYYPDEQQQIS